MSGGATAVNFATPSSGLGGGYAMLGSTGSRQGDALLASLPGLLEEGGISGGTDHIISPLPSQQSTRPPSATRRPPSASSAPGGGHPSLRPVSAGSERGRPVSASSERGNADFHLGVVSDGY